jgi:predicted nucleic-acid-binding protein
MSLVDTNIILRYLLNDIPEQSEIARLELKSLCTALFAQQKVTLTDTRDGKTYKTVKIGEQVWFQNQ